MTSSPLVFFHIWAALIGISFGSGALFFRKGSRLHRAAGNVFFISMLTMSASAAYMAAFVKPEMINVLAGILTFYLVATAWVTIRRKPGETGLFEIGAMLAASATGIGGLIFGLEAVNSARGLKDGFPAAAYFGFGSVALCFAGSDIRMLVRGGVSGAPRIARHLWRMSFALLIATASLFLGQQKMFPKGVRGTKALFVPVVVIIVAMIYWMIRIRFTNARKKVPEAAGVRAPSSAAFPAV